MSYAGDTEHHLDRGVHSPEPKGANRELHLCVLIASKVLHSLVRILGLDGAVHGRKVMSGVSAFCECTLELVKARRCSASKHSNQNISERTGMYFRLLIQAKLPGSVTYTARTVTRFAP